MSASFIYDMEGRRTDQTVNGHRLQSFWIGDELSFTIPYADYAHRIRLFSPYPESGLNELTFRRIGDDASEDRFILRDGNNNVIALTDANQQSRTQYTYQPYRATTRTGAADVITCMIGSMECAANFRVHIVPFPSHLSHSPPRMAGARQT
ncbi:hypothetical protein, partial [Paraburkholderia sp. DHOC27]|uniref:hypothetical protein n=1 Tax=Paraburkholderia sp. DHOC27 TaxID=2303330 RepID=UPI00216B3BB4